jgi:uncharacterized membrane protein YphA (DoxX/SURF4 family)
LRTAIGWHFLYEGVDKIYSSPEGRSSWLVKVLPPPLPAPPMEKPEAPFSAEIYLRNATGPLAPYFRSLVPDVESRSKLDLNHLKAFWADEMERYASQYQFSVEQREAAQQAVSQQEAEAEAWFHDAESAKQVRTYFDELDHLKHRMSDPKLLESERAQMFRDRSSVESQRRALVQTVDGWTDALKAKWMKLATPEQQQAGPVPQPWTQLDSINAATKYSLAVIGLCLLAGFLSRLAALGAVAYLAMFYLSMPPWPGLPASPMAEGHYLFVNKNLIELLACLVLASLPTGYWVGLDALLFGWLRRRRQAAKHPELFDNPSDDSHADRRRPGSYSRSNR